MTKPTLLLSLDVESYGILGKPFSYGIVLYDLQAQKVVDEIYEFSAVSLAEARKPRIDQWVENYVVIVASTPTTTISIEESFLNTWYELVLKYSEYNFVWCADHPHPVESLFISNVLKSRYQWNFWSDLPDLELSPYPLLDVNSIRWSYSLPTTFERLSNELPPSHHPLMDARQSLRGLLEAMKRAERLGIVLQF